MLLFGYYEKIPTRTIAFQFTGEPDNVERISEWLKAYGVKFKYTGNRKGMAIILVMKRGEMTASKDDYIVAGSSSLDFYPCKPDIFSASYRKIVDIEPDHAEYESLPYVKTGMVFTGSKDSMKIAFRWIGKMKAKDISPYIKGDVIANPGRVPTYSFTINTLEGPQDCLPGDMIIKGIKNEFYPCKMEVFKRTYKTHRGLARYEISNTDGWHIVVRYDSAYPSYKAGVVMGQYRKRKEAVAEKLRLEVEQDEDTQQSLMDLQAKLLL